MPGPQMRRHFQVQLMDVAKLNDFKHKVSQAIDHMNEYDTGKINQILMKPATDVCAIPSQDAVHSVWHETGISRPPEACGPITTLTEMCSPRVRVLLWQNSSRPGDTGPPFTLFTVNNKNEAGKEGENGLAKYYSKLNNVAGMGIDLLCTRP